MSKKKYVRKMFAIHEHEKEEEFLSSMAKKGYRFVKIHYGLPTKYEFDIAEPEDIIYQLDYVSTKEDNDSYHKLFKDSGWEEVFSWNGADGKWYYFKRQNDGKLHKIFTDLDSKLDLYNKIFKKYSLFFLLLSFTYINGIRVSVDGILRDDINILFKIFSLIILALSTFAIIFIIYSLIGLSKKRKEIKDKILQKL